jgi:hypothetical protein
MFIKVLYKGWNLIPITQLVQKWNDEVIASDPSGQPLVDLVLWLSRATLDVIGEGVGPCCRDAAVLTRP